MNIMSENFDTYNAPQFLDFESADDDQYADAYFDAITQFDQAEHSIVKMRKSMSVGNLVMFNEQEHYKVHICEQIEKLDINVKQNKNKSHEKHKKNKTVEKPLGKRYASLDNLKSATKKFVSLAEFLNTYQNKTPKRFRSKPNLSDQGPIVHQPLKLTIPQSPALQTKKRHRVLNILSQEEREINEKEKFKFKARSLNKKIMNGPMKVIPPVEKKVPTIPQPFSFDRQIKLVQDKRQQMINKVLEEEKKAREFYAKPIPKSVKIEYSSAKSNKSGSDSSIGSSRKHPSIECIPAHFKAKAPTVLYKEPFEPKKQQKVTEIIPFQLSTDLRASEREEFQKHKIEREQRLAYVKHLAEEQRLLMEQEEAAKFRKETEFKAQPVKKYKQIIIQPSNKVTEPVSPKFHSMHLRHKANKENISNN